MESSDIGGRDGVRPKDSGQSKLRTVQPRTLYKYLLARIESDQSYKLKKDADGELEDALLGVGTYSELLYTSHMVEHLARMEAISQQFACRLFGILLKLIRRGLLPDCTRSVDLAASLRSVADIFRRSSIITEEEADQLRHSILRGNAFEMVVESKHYAAVLFDLRRWHGGTPADRTSVSVAWEQFSRTLRGFHVAV